MIDQLPAPDGARLNRSFYGGCRWAVARRSNALYVPPSGDITVQLGRCRRAAEALHRAFVRSRYPLIRSRRRVQGRRCQTIHPGLVRRWYLAPVAENGTNDDPYRVETLGRGGSALLPSHPQGHPRHGHPMHDVALVLVSSDDHGPLEADPRISPVADLTDLDLPAGELDATKRAWIESVTEVRQVVGDGLVRDAVRLLGQQLEPDFNEENYWVK